MLYEKRVEQRGIKENPVILAIESSCDETACAVLRGRCELLSSEIESSMTEHIRFGGVVPEIASRAHTAAVSIVVERAIKNAGISLSDIDAVAVTYGAGLLGALLVGVSYAKALAYSLGVPIIPVSHIRGHLAAIYLADKNLRPPFISVLASGGHTAIIEVENFNDFKVLGGTLDDAVGEAFDKVARVLGLNYPGGPNIERLAREGENVVPMPKMLKGKGGFDFSYSGLKTAVINYVHTKEQKGESYNKADVACSFQHAATGVLVEKAIEAAKTCGLKTITLGGGVAANGYLRETLASRAAKAGITAVIPPKGLCTDNAAMIAAEGYLRYINGNFAGLDLNAKAQVDLGTI
ncbi:MAG: tRNA (adenosine(37)-N6)-threonylcarbamoyltransferase complex transferase subunit TsaD [Candidatus Borkfalkiaceae bacterium]|nr:tRNA (adenosine(37)-N6)-threonylcarbamoyltransferase complex transferase subunit TsaD [Christensenellaceae bacterium]